MPGSNPQMSTDIQAYKMKTDIQGMKPNETISQKLAVIRQVLLMLAGIAVATPAFYLFVYQQTRLQQALLPAGVILLSYILAAPISYLLAKGGKSGAAGFVILLGVFISYGVNELVWKGLTLYHVLGGVILMALLGNMVLQEKRSYWLAADIIYLVSILAINVFPPAIRYDASQMVLMNGYAASAAFLIGLFATLTYLHNLQRRTIRTRLILMIGSLILVSVAVTMAVSAFLSNRSSQAQVINQLESVIVLKEANLHSWKIYIQSNLSNQLPTSESYPNWNLLLTAKTKKPASAEYKNAYDLVKSRFTQALGQSSPFQEIFLMDADGTILISTNSTQEKQNLSSRAYFQKGLKGYYLDPPNIEPDMSQLTMVVAIPIQINNDQSIGVLAGRLAMQKLSETMLIRSGLGSSGETYMVQQRNHKLLTDSRFPGWIAGESILFSNGINNALDRQQNGAGVYTSYRGTQVLGVYHWLPELQVALLAEQDRSEALASTYAELIFNTGAATLALIFAMLSGLLATRNITQPLGELARTAEQISAGNIHLTAPENREDEIGALAKAFNSMTAQLRALIEGLERKVADRTKELERRSIQIQAAAEVAHDTTAVRNLDQVLNRAVNLIRDRFGFYHAGIFLIDEKREYAVLRAATGEAGRQMLEKEHKLKIGDVGLVGYVTTSGQPRIASNVSADSIHFQNPLLPDTRSEMTLPLKTGDTVIGVLDVQSTEESAFDAEDTQALQTMADQLAVAIENARLSQKMEDTLQQLESTQDKYTQETWLKLTRRSGQLLGYRYRGLGVEPADLCDPEAQEALQQGKSVTVELSKEPSGNGKDVSNALAVPIRMRNQVIGVIDMHFEGQPISPELITTFEEIASRLSLSIESARLLEETQLRSEQLSMLQEITAAAASHLRVQELLEDIGDRLRTGFKFERCSVVLFDTERKFGRIVADQGDNQNGSTLDMTGTEFILAEVQAFQEIMESQKTQVLYAAQDHPKAAGLQELVKVSGAHSLMLSPLFSRGEVIGLIAMAVNDPKRFFTDDDLRLIDQISLQISVALDVARLFEQTDRRAERERMLSDITSKVRASTNVDVILQTSIKELARALHLSTGSIHIKVGDGGLTNE